MEIEIQLSYLGTTIVLLQAVSTLLETSHYSSKPRRNALLLSKEFSHLDEGENGGDGGLLLGKRRGISRPVALGTGSWTRIRTT